MLLLRAEFPFPFSVPGFSMAVALYTTLWMCDHLGLTYIVCHSVRFRMVTFVWIHSNFELMMHAKIVKYVLSPLFLSTRSKEGEYYTHKA